MRISTRGTNCPMFRVSIIELDQQPIGAIWIEHPPGALYLTELRVIRLFKRRDDGEPITRQARGRVPVCGTSGESSDWRAYPASHPRFAPPHARGGTSRHAGTTRASRSDDGAAVFPPQPHCPHAYD